LKSSFCKPLVELAEKKFRDVPKEAGVYVIFWIRNGKPVAIPRIRGVDEKGILYMGSTKNLRQRIRDLWRSIQVARGLKDQNSYPHTFGVSLLYTGLCDAIADRELCIYFKVFNNEDAEYWEKVMLLEYTRRYGEPPPLNLNVGRKYLLIVDLGVFDESRFVEDLDPELHKALGL